MVEAQLAALRGFDPVDQSLWRTPEAQAEGCSVVTGRVGEAQGANMTKIGDFGDFRIAGKKKISHWIELRKDLERGKKSEGNNWKVAFDDFFFERVSTRYFDPIKALQSQ